MNGSQKQYMQTSPEANSGLAVTGETIVPSFDPDTQYILHTPTT